MDGQCEEWYTSYKITSCFYLCMASQFEAQKQNKKNIVKTLPPTKIYRQLSSKYNTLLPSKFPSVKITSFCFCLCFFQHNAPHLILLCSLDLDTLRMVSEPQNTWLQLSNKNYPSVVEGMAIYVAVTTFCSSLYTCLTDQHWNICPFGLRLVCFCTQPMTVFTALQRVHGVSMPAGEFEITNGLPAIWYHSGGSKLDCKVFMYMLKGN